MEQHQVEDLVRHREEHRRLLHDVQNLQVDGDLVSVSLVVRYLRSGCCVMSMVRTGNSAKR